MHDLLVLSPDLPPQPALTYAAGLARHLGARVSGLKVCEPFLSLEGTALPAASAMALAWSEDCLSEARAAGPGFERWAAAQGLKQARWLVAQGELPATVAQLGSWHDLLVVQRDDRNTWGTVNALGQLLLVCGMPMLVLPQSGSPEARFDRIAVAWNGSPEATRALRSALPLLKRAQTVLLLSGKRHEPFVPVLTPRFDAAEWLATEGITVSHCLLDRPAEQDGAEFLDMAQSQQADLLVMGGYGRSRFAEWMLGGATRLVLLRARLPVLLRH